MFDGLQDAPVPVTTEANYRDVPDSIHGLRKSAWCPEIGNSTGMGLLQLRGKAVAVDPGFRLADIGRDLQKGRERLHRFLTTSDTFLERPCGNLGRASWLRVYRWAARVAGSPARPHQHSASLRLAKSHGAA